MFKQLLKVNRAVVFWNSVVLLGFFALTIYAKLWDKGEGVIFLFTDDFSSKRPYLGLFTNISDVLWCISATICFFSYSLLQWLHPRRIQDLLFFLCSGIGISILLMDDIFRLTLMLYIYADIPKLTMYVFYGLGAIAYSLCFWRKLLSTPYILLAIAGVLFIISGAADLTPLVGQGTPAMLEDGTKLLALLNVALYFWQVCRQAILSTLKHSR